MPPASPISFKHHPRNVSPMSPTDRLPNPNQLCITPSTQYRYRAEQFSKSTLQALRTMPNDHDLFCSSTHLSLLNMRRPFPVRLHHLPLPTTFPFSLLSTSFHLSSITDPFPSSVHSCPSPMAMRLRDPRPKPASCSPWPSPMLRFTRRSVAIFYSHRHPFSSTSR